MTRLDRYTCEEVFRRLDDYLDRELTETEMALVQAHLETCAVCAREHDFEASVIRQVKTKLRRVSAPPDLLARISSALATTEAE
ncbi:MAG: alpha-ketoglutarate decarboxylase [Armatimonadetes bacterium]|nr:alpha-ketoglutarate decarboxylase [Armatimonadota bacterium]